LGEEEFTILVNKRNAFVCNVSRGEVLDQKALAAAVRKSPGGLRGTALDVAAPEPLLEDNELWDPSNVFITPHVNGRNSAYGERVLQILDANLMRLERGEGLINVIYRKP
jgi:phosphoglycerate dehydrogenase-like enzyme